MTKDEAIKLALESLERADKLFGSDDSDIKAINALKEVIASPNEKLMHPEIKKMYEDFFDKCFAESSKLNAVLEEAMKVEGPLHVVCQCDKCKAEKQEQGEPVAWMSKDEHEVYTSKQVDGYFQHDHIPLYTTPQPRTWVGLTDEQIDGLHNKIRVQLMGTFNIKDIYRVIEAELRSNNT